jgi:ABC-type multidrug transport system ATPase subunit
MRVAARHCPHCGGPLELPPDERPTRVDRPIRAPAPARQPGVPLGPLGSWLTIGRDPGDIQLASPQVSRRHAQVERTPAGDLLRDLGSTNGVFVNGRRVAEHLLAPGDVIQIGAFKLAYDGQALTQLGERGALRLEALSLRRTVVRNGRARTILRDVSLAIAPREFVSLVGPSGAGKTTLLDALSGQAPASAGRVLVNGDDLYASFAAYRAAFGYVPQDATLHGRLPAERALRYTAELRLPADSAGDEIEARVRAVLADVGMAGVGARPIDALSGGQRKRISIAAELLADPALFFLDEPAAGLDPGLEQRLMQTLRDLADSGRTVVLVTHATANIMLCDQVAFLAGGRLIFFGPPADAPAFFGLPPGDFAGIYTRLDGSADARDPQGLAFARRMLPRELAALQAERPANARGPSLAQLWELRFQASPYYQRYVAGRLADAERAQPAAGPPLAARPRSALRQLWVLVRRYADVTVQDRRNLALLLAQAPAIGLLIALVARADAFVGSSAYGNEAKKVLFMLATVAVWFGVINAAREIAKEAPIVRRERRAGLRLAPYLLSKVCVLAVLVLLQSAALLACVALRVRFPAQGLMLPFAAEIYITTALTGLAGLALGLAISSAAGTPDRATSLVPLALVPQILFAGLIFSLGSGLTLQRVLSWFTLSRWAMDAYGASANLNALPPAPGLLRLAEPQAEYLATPEHILSRWLILLACAALGLLAAALIMWLRERRR